jgi:hypothetical protein
MPASGTIYPGGSENLTGALAPLLIQHSKLHAFIANATAGQAEAISHHPAFPAFVPGLLLGAAKGFVGCAVGTCPGSVLTDALQFLGEVFQYAQSAAIAIINSIPALMFMRRIAQERIPVLPQLAWFARPSFT